MVQRRSAGGYNDFIKALLFDDVKGMNVYMNKVAMATFSYFDTGKVLRKKPRNVSTMVLFWG